MGVLVLLAFGGGGGGVVQNRESPDFRSPEVGRYECSICSFFINMVQLSCL